MHRSQYEEVSAAGLTGGAADGTLTATSGVQTMAMTPVILHQAQLV